MKKSLTYFFLLSIFLVKNGHSDCYEVEDCSSNYSEPFEIGSAKYNEIAKSIKESGGIIGLINELSGLPNLFMGKILRTDEEVVQIALKHHHQNSHYISNLIIACHDQKVFFFNPSMNSEKSKCRTLITEKEILVEMQYESEQSRPKFSKYDWVEISTNKFKTKKTWVKRGLNTDEIKDAAYFQLKHTGLKYQSRYYEFEKTSFVLETKIGDFMFLPLVEVAGEFISPLMLVVKKNDNGKWQEYLLSESIGYPIYDIDGDSFPEFSSGTDYNHGWWRIYPKQERLLKGGL